MKIFTAFTLMLLEMSNNFVTNKLSNSISLGTVSADVDQLQGSESTNNIFPTISTQDSRSYTSELHANFFR